jgi:5'(3')-deoxyribonucleotidase
LKTVAIDLDSVLNNLGTKWILEDYNSEYNDNLTEENMVCWDVEKYVKPECCKKIYEFLLRPKYFLSLSPTEDSQRVTKLLKDSGEYELYVVTAFHPKTVEDKYEWIKIYFPHINPKHIVFCNPKGLIATDYLIDDGGHNIEDFASNAGKCPIIFDKPWNKYLGDSYTRAKNWKHIEEMLLGN